MLFYTMGVYGLSEEAFFANLLANHIDTFIDIRRRRAVRGSQYAFVNSKRLQNRLAGLNIKYIHLIHLAPTTEIRQLQYIEDQKSKISKRSRQQLSDIFVAAYNDQILQRFSLETLIAKLASDGTESALLFCVEKDARACHRSIVAEKLHHDFAINTIHL